MNIRCILTRILVFVALFGGASYGQEEKKEVMQESELVTLPKRGEPILYGQAAFPMERWKKVSESAFPWFVPVETKKGWHLDWDCEREELRYLIVHHTATANPTGTPKQRRDFLTYLSELERDRLYKGVFGDQQIKTPYVFGLPVRSGHTLEGEGETFEPYHHLIYPDGTMETRLIPYRKNADGKYAVEMIGWHAGSWKINVCSVGVALVDNYKDDKPPQVVIEKLNALVAYYRGLVPTIEIKPHREVKKNGETDCPGAWYDDWAQTLHKK